MQSLASITAAEKHTLMLIDDGQTGGWRDRNLISNAIPCFKQVLRNSYAMGFPPVRGDNPRALASGLSYVQVDKHDITILYHLHQCIPCTPRDISC